MKTSFKGEFSNQVQQSDRGLSNILDHLCWPSNHRKLPPACSMKVLCWNKSGYAKPNIPCWYQMGPRNVLHSMAKSKDMEGGKERGSKKTKNKTGLLWRSVHFTSLEAISYSKVRSARKLHKNRQLTIWISGFSNWRLRKDQLMTVWYSAFFKIYSFIANVYQFKILIIMSLITNNQYQPWGKHIGRSLPAKTNNYRDFTF